MDALPLFGLHFTLSFIIFALIARWYISPRLAKLTLEEALVPLFLVHALRYLPSTAFAPGQVDPHIPEAMTTIAFGDLASAILALIAVFFLKNKWAGAIPVAWTVNILMAADWLAATYLAASTELVTYELGGNWYIISYFVPVIAVIHIMIFFRLKKGA